MITHTPVRKNRAHIVIPTFLIAFAVILVLASSLGAKPALLLQLSGVVLITAGIQLSGRFALTDFTYTITEFDDTPAECIVITRTRGRQSTSEYLPLSGITGIRAPGSEIPPEVKAKHNFCVSMTGAEPYIILFNDPASSLPSAALLECPASFAAQIETRIHPVTPSL